MVKIHEKYGYAVINRSPQSVQASFPFPLGSASYHRIPPRTPPQIWPPDVLGL